MFNESRYPVASRRTGLVVKTYKNYVSALKFAYHFPKSAVMRHVKCDCEKGQLHGSCLICKFLG